MSRAAMDGFQVAIRAVGADANRQSLDAIEELALTYKNDRRWRIEHSQPLDPSDQPRLGKNGIIASMQPDYPAGNPHPLPGIAAAARLTALTTDDARAAFAEDPTAQPAPAQNPDFLLLHPAISTATPPASR